MRVAACARTAVLRLPEGHITVLAVLPAQRQQLTDVRAGGSTASMTSWSHRASTIVSDFETNSGMEAHLRGDDDAKSEYDREPGADSESHLSLPTASNHRSRREC